MPDELLEATLNIQPILTLLGFVTIFGGLLIGLLSLRLSVLFMSFAFGFWLIFASEIMTLFQEPLEGQYSEVAVSVPEAKGMSDSQPAQAGDDESKINETEDVKKNTKGKSFILDICISLGILIFAYKFCRALYLGLRTRTMRAEIIREFSRREGPQEAPQQRELAEPAPIILSEQDSDSDFCSMSKGSLKTSRKIQLD